ncbi:pilus assembly protein PilM [Ferrimicrobium acidiphilum]|uniref:pilus assembly protein PilM n=1 Tax=Ferrimicrobium acidiphilum TaxID=121039 RepID=UPI0023F2F8C4|nr:pilus assembly protein PilM [Ferrimicrobium acidiphilum]MCL5053027.1 pilus assembly protein PilM [Gammaproteobacteria bacterium]
MEKLILLEIGAFSMKACEIEIGRRSRPPLWLAHRVLPDGADQDQEKIVETLRGLLKDVGTHTKSTRLVVTDPDLVVRSLNVPSSDKNELEMTFGFAMTEVLPLPLDELVVDYETTAQGRSANSNVVMAGAPKAIISKSIDVAERSGLRVDWVDVGPLAAARAVSELSRTPGDGYYLVVVGATTTTIEVVVGDQPQLVRSIKLGGELITREIATSLEVGYEAAEGLKRAIASVGSEAGNALGLEMLHVTGLETANDIVAEGVHSIVREVASSIDYFAIQRGYTDIDRLVLVGGSSAVDRLGVELGEKLQLRVERPGPRQLLRLIEADSFVEESSSNWVEITGAVMRARTQSKDAKFVNLLPARVRARRLRRRQLMLAGVMGVVLVAAGAFLTVQRYDQLRQVDAAQVSLGTQLNVLSGQMSHYAKYGALAQGVASERSTLTSQLKSSVDFPQLLTQISAATPSDSWLTSLSIQAPTSSVTGSSGLGVTFSLEGCSQLAPAHWLNSMAKLDFLANLWVSTSTLTPAGSGSTSSCSVGVPSSEVVESGMTTYQGSAVISNTFGQYRSASYLSHLGVS